MKRRQHTAVALFWIFCVAITAHLLYSSLGFNPTDDGFTLAYSRRILDGQVPHRDFIIIRPTLSPALHVPEVFFGGDYVFWLSRFVFFFQCACIAWFGTVFVNKSMRKPFGVVEQSALALISFAFCCHSFPVMAWHTIDGLFLCALGLCLRTRPYPCAQFIGYFLIAAAYLCKQSFVFVAPGVLLLFGDWRKWRCLLASALPGLLYVAYLFLAGGLLDGLQQLLTQTGILHVGVRQYLNIQLVGGLTAGLVVTGLLCHESATDLPGARRLRRVAGLVLMAVAFGMATLSLFHDRLISSSFAVFGMVCGVVVYLAVEGGRSRIRELKTGMVAALLAWSASLSLGYNSPVLGGGILITFLFSVCYRQFARKDLHWRWMVLLAATLLATSAFHFTRTHYIYREQPASLLTCSLGDVLPGARLIRTNPNTYAFLADLNEALRIAASNGVKYAIVPEVAAHWVKSGQRNPLPIDWAQSTELNTAALTDRALIALKQQRHQQMVIVQKVTADALPYRFVTLKTEDPSFAVVAYVRTHFEKLGETRYFDLYK